MVATGLPLLVGVGSCNKAVVDPDPLPVAPTPSLTVAPARLAAFSGRVGVAAPAQSFTVSGLALTAPIRATAPAGYELALDPAAIYAPTVAVTPAVGAVTVVYVRLAAAGGPGTLAGDIVVSSAGSVSQSVAVTGTVEVMPLPVAPAPTLGGFLPASGPGGTLLTLTGTNFLGATGVTWNGVALPGFNVVSASVITVAVPVGTGAGSGFLTVTTPTGTATSTTAFAVVPPGPTVLRTGTMQSQGGVPSSGTVSIERDAAGVEYVRFHADFDTDFHLGTLGVFLAKSDALIRVQEAASPSNVLRVATINRDGAMTLPIPGSATGFTHVIIHCDAARYNFGAALLQ